MSNVLTIGALKDFPIKPIAWRITETPDYYILRYTFLENFTTFHPSNWLPLMTRRNSEKTYKSIQAALQDVKRVQTHAVVLFDFDHKKESQNI